MLSCVGKKVLGLLIGVLLFFFHSYLYGQENQNDTLNSRPDTTLDLSEKDIARVEIKRAFRNSLIPGFAQFKNKDYLKIPVIYAGIGVMGTLAYNHHQQYQSNVDQFDDFLQGNTPFSYAITSKTDEFQKNVDLVRKHKLRRNIFLAGASSLYLLNIADGIRPVATDIHSPYKAALYSALIPGLGQIYNGQWWKVPLVYAGFGAFGYFIDYNNKRYQSRKDAYLLRYKYRGNEELLAHVDNIYARNMNFTDDMLIQSKDRWKRYRDQVILSTIAFYGINIIDALVFAYLHDYDVSDDISDMAVDVKPTVLPAPGETYAMGLRCSFRF